MNLKNTNAVISIIYGYSNTDAYFAGGKRVWKE